MDISDYVGSSNHKELVATLEIRSAKILFGDTTCLDAGAHAAVEDDDSVMDCLKECAHRGSPEDGLGAERGSVVISPQAGASRPTHQVSFGSHTVAEQGRDQTLEAGLPLGCL
ncbi:unannotated protein [freshwater metagenome]|uniref:Unannotated protein n=1 Tax=freshwater metagenome TaxID=449393 RepID=A0A6J7MSJ1_9ZZZZ